MNKTDLINQLADRLDGDKKAAQTAVEGLIDLVQREVHKGSSVSISGFGVFEKRARAARTARNPRTGEAVKVKKTTVPAFRPGKYFKDVISGTVKMPKATGAPTTARAAAALAKAGPARTTTRAPRAASGAAATTAAPKTTATRTRAAAKPAAATATAEPKTTRTPRATAAKTAPAAKTTTRSTAAKAPAKTTAAKSTAAKTTASTAKAPAKTAATKAPAKSTAAKTPARRAAAKTK